MELQFCSQGFQLMFIAGRVNKVLFIGRVSKVLFIFANNVKIQDI